MKELFISLILIITALLIVFCFSSKKRNVENMDKLNTEVTTVEPINNLHRMGPILLKIQDEWFITEHDKKYIKIGLLKEDQTSETPDYPILSAKALSFSTDEAVLLNKKNRNREYEIITYNIVCPQNPYWIDINVVLNNYYYDNSDHIETCIFAERHFYIFHPKKQKWLGPELNNLTSFEMIMYSELYNETNTTKDVKELISKYINERESVIESIINKRTLVVPSLKFYNEVLYGFTIAKSGRVEIYDWFDEKKELEKVAPKDEDE